MQSVLIRRGPQIFLKETPLVFYKKGKPSLSLEFLDGLNVVLESMVSLEKWKVLKLRSSFGGCSKQGTCLVESGIRMAVACLMNLLENLSLTCDLIPSTKKQRAQSSD